MSDQFPIELQTLDFVRLFFHSQLFRTPPVPAQSFANQTVIVTGSNVGLGFEAARYFYSLNCAKLILAVRTVSKGQKAKEDIVRSVTHRYDADAIEVWPLDLTSTDSTLAFAERAKRELARVDAVIENAGISARTWTASKEGWEMVLQVNVINTLLLALLLLPKLKETKSRFPDSSPHLEIVSSEAHKMSDFKEINAPKIYDKLNNEKTFNGGDRYPVSKLLEILFVRELVSRLAVINNSSIPPVTITMVNPGLCWSDIDRNSDFTIRTMLWIMRTLLARTTEVGARTLVLGACAGPKSHGEMMSNGENEDVERWIYSDVGKRAQKKAFEQTMEVLESRSPGIGKSIGL